jgi:hypothetical protein
MNRRARALIRAGGGRMAVDLDYVVVIRRRGDRTEIVHAPRLVDGTAVRAVEAFCTGYDGDDLLHDVELAFPRLAYRDFFCGYRRYLAAERWVQGEGT